MRRPLFLLLAVAAILGLEHEQRASARLVISEVMSANASTSIPGRLDFPDWIEIRNDSGRRIDLAGFHLTDDPRRPAKWRFPSVLLEPDQFLVVLATGDPASRPPAELASGAAAYPEASFRLDSAGEYLAIVAPDGASVLDAIDPVPGHVDRSWGLVPGDGSHARAWLSQASPGAPNDRPLAGLLDEPRFDREHGFADAPFLLTLGASDPAATIRFTVDGSEPDDRNGATYREPIRIERTTVVRAVAMREGYGTSTTGTRSYFFLDDVIRQSPDGEPPPGWPRERRINDQVLDYGMDPDVVDSLHSVEELKESLRDVPTVSLVLPIESLLHPTRGIYVNPARRGPLWERPVSVEYIDAKRDRSFQIDAGLRLRGNHSRRPENPAHAFRLVFRGRYGERRLVFPLFGAEGRVFDHLDLVTSLNWSWAVSESGREEDLERMTMLRDVFCRDTHRAMGRPGTRSDYCHLYINGVYWGLYLTQERPSAAFAASRLGGSRQDYDVIKAAGVVVDGTNEGLLDLYDKAIRKDFSDPGDWLALQGTLDVDSLVDYMLALFHGGMNDGPGGFHRSFPNNYYGIHRRGAMGGWQWLVHDAEHSLDVGELDMTRSLRGHATRPEYLNPYDLHRSLLRERRYRKRFSARAQSHLLGDGALTDEACLERLDRRAREIEKAIVAHSARWGDAARERPLTVADWRRAVDRTRAWLAGRSERILDQLDRINLYSGARPPVLVISPRGDRRLLPTDGTTYYTIDGTDPRGADDRPSASATRLTTPAMDERVIVALDGPCRIRVPAGSRDMTGWTTRGYDDAGWRSVEGGMGFSGSTPFDEYIGENVQEILQFQNASLQARWRFEDAGAGEDELILLQVRCDDGFVAYLDGEEIGELGKPDVLRWNSTSLVTSLANDVDILELPVRGLTPGPHLLAVQGMNEASDEKDFLLAVGLVGRTYRSPPLPPGKIVARSFHRGRWSPPRVIH